MTIKLFLQRRHAGLTMKKQHILKRALPILIMNNIPLQHWIFLSNPSFPVMENFENISILSILQIMCNIHK